MWTLLKDVTMFYSRLLFLPLCPFEIRLPRRFLFFITLSIWRRLFFPLVEWNSLENGGFFRILGSFRMCDARAGVSKQKNDLCDKILFAKCWREKNEFIKIITKQLSECGFWDKKMGFLRFHSTSNAKRAKRIGLAFLWLFIYLSQPSKKFIHIIIELIVFDDVVKRDGHRPATIAFYS